MSGSIFDAMGSAGTNPGLMALIGAAGGFGQAAMPQPFRGGTPFGAALGMAAQGMGQGAGNAYQNQLRQAQAQGQQLQNTATQSQLPLMLARNKMLASVYQNPAMLQQLMGQSSGSSQPSDPSAPQPQAAGSPTPIVNAALASIPDPQARSLAFNAAMRAKLPMDAWAPWVSAVHNESGWNLGQQDGGSGEIGPGQVMPDTGKGLGYTTQQLRDPATNLLASAQYFGQKWGQANGNPSSALAGYNTGDVAGSAPDYVGKGMTRLGGWGYAGAQGQQGAGPAQQGGAPQAPAGTPQSDALMAQANELERKKNLATFFGFPGPPGDPAAIRTAAQQTRAMELAGPTEANKAANAVTVDRFGNMYRGTQYIGRGSEVKQAWDPTQGRFVYQDVGGVGVGAIPPTMAGANAPPLASEPGPAEKERLEASGKAPITYMNEDKAELDKAQADVVDNIRPAQQILLQLRNLNPDANTGAAGELRTQLKNWVQTFAPTLADKMDMNAAPAQEFQKFALMGAGKQERGDLGARGGFRAIEMYAKANPNIENQPTANHDMANALLVAHQYHVDYATGASSYWNNQYNASGQPGSSAAYQPVAQNFDPAFSQTMRPQLYASAMDALNGKPWAAWSKGLNHQDQQIVAGVVQRADPSATIDIEGKPVPVAAVRNTFDPTQIKAGGANGGQ